MFAPKNYASYFAAASIFLIASDFYTDDADDSIACLTELSASYIAVIVND